MSRLRAPNMSSKIQPEVVDLVHNEVVSLCQKMYNSIAGIEIDGIICISLLDTKEQQVVKIHKTLKSVVADAARKVQTSKSSAYPRIACILSDPPVSNDSPQVAVNSRNGRRSASNTNQRASSYIDQLMGQRQEAEIPDFQKDISVLNDLLHSNTMLGAELQTMQTKRGATFDSNTKSRRKRKQQRESFENPQETEFSRDNIVRGPVQDTTDASNEKVVIKEEPYDPSYEENANSANIDQNYSANTGNIADTRSENNGDGSDQNNQSENKFDHTDSTRECSSEKEKLNEQIESEINVSTGLNGEVKVENTSEDSDYGLSGGEIAHRDSSVNTAGGCGSRQSSAHNADMAQVDWLAPETSGASQFFGAMSEGVDGAQQELSSGSKKHWLFGLGKNPRQEGEPMSDPETQINEVSRSALMNKFYREGSMAHKGIPPSHYDTNRRKDPKGRSWIEMVKDNVSKYQAALMRSSKKEDSPVGSASELLKTLAAPNTNSNYLKSLLKQPALHENKGDGTGATNSGSDGSRSTSVSPAPEIKIEIDEEPEYPQTEQMLAQEEGDKPPSGKLESRYPALFNQLQQAKQSTSSEDQNDSLVNRLPFISFQELFATANPRMSESTTRDLLERAKMSPFPSKANTTKKKSVWKWKKRQVRPKNNIEDPSYSQDDDIAMIARKTFSRKRVKEEDSEDSEWVPSGAELAGGELSQKDTDEVAKKKIKTRLSLGEKPRVNFAEIENSGFEFEEEEDFETNDEATYNPIQLVSAYCNKKCGLRFDSFLDLKLHEDTCTYEGEVVPVGGAVEVNTAEGGPGVEKAGPSGEDFKCTICGLEFNQEYRCHYHMVKVHGVSGEKTDLFR